MEVVHLNQKQLAARWQLSEACVERWRSEGIGPKFMKLKGRVLYRLVGELEEACRMHLAVMTKALRCRNHGSAGQSQSADFL